MVFLRGMVNAGSLVKNLTCTNTSPVLSNMAVSSMFLKRDISQSGQQSSESKGLSPKFMFFLLYSYISRSFWFHFLLISLFLITSANYLILLLHMQLLPKINHIHLSKTPAIWQSMLLLDLMIF